MLHDRFDHCSNVYEEALLLAYNCQDFKDGKPKSLAYFIIDELKNWKAKLDDQIQPSLLTTEIKISAFNVVRQQRSFDLMKLVALVYEMEKHSDMFLDRINYMIREKEYKEVSSFPFSFFFFL